MHMWHETTISIRDYLVKCEFSDLVLRPIFIPWLLIEHDSCLCFTVLNYCFYLLCIVICLYIIYTFF